MLTKSIAKTFATIAVAIFPVSAVIAQDLSLSDFNDQPLIRVQGTGRVATAADLAVINLGAEAQAKTAAEARTSVAEAMTIMIDAVRAAGVEDKDIQTQHLSLNPVYAPDGAGKIAGYQGQHQLSVKVRDVSRVGTVIDEALKAGGNAGRMYGLSFTIEDPSAAETTAREEAYANALAKAQELAKAAGLTLGKPIRIVEAPAVIPGPMPMRGVAMRMAADTATPIATGEQEVSVAIDVVYNIAEGATQP